MAVDEEEEDYEVEDHGRERAHILLGHVSEREKALLVAPTRLEQIFDFSLLFICDVEVRDQILASIT